MTFLTDGIRRMLLALTARSLIAVALGALVLGLVAVGTGHGDAARWIWGWGTVPVLAGLLSTMIRDILAGRMGVDAIAFVSMAAALALGETLAAVVVAVMFAGGNALEEYAVGRAERDLKALADRAPRIAHRKRGDLIEDVAVDEVTIGDLLIVRAGQIIPVDGVIASNGAVFDESALTGEPIPVHRQKGEAVRSGALNAGDTFEMKASASAGESTYAGIVRMVTAAQTAKAPFIRLADKYALLLLPLTLLVAGGATFAAFPQWYATLFSGFYLALFLILFGLIIRNVSFEFWGKAETDAGRERWEWAMVLGSALPALLWGVGWANIVHGVPIDGRMEYTGNLLDLLHPYALLGGLASLTIFLAHGAIYLNLKTTREIGATPPIPSATIRWNRLGSSTIWMMRRRSTSPGNAINASMQR